MAYNFNSECHVNWPTTFSSEALYQDSLNVGVLLCTKAKSVLCPSYHWIFFLCVLPERFSYFSVKYVGSNCFCQWCFVKSCVCGGYINSLLEKKSLFSVKLNKIK